MIFIINCYSAAMIAEPAILARYEAANYIPHSMVDTSSLEDPAEYPGKLRQFEARAMVVSSFTGLNHYKLKKLVRDNQKELPRHKLIIVTQSQKQKVDGIASIYMPPPQGG